MQESTARLIKCDIKEDQNNAFKDLSCTVEIKS